MDSVERQLQAPPDDAPEWARVAWKLISKQGLSITKAAATVGKHPKSLRYWVIAGEPERQRANAKRWREENPERARELGRENQNRRRWSDPEGTREYWRRYRARADQARRARAAAASAALNRRPAAPRNVWTA